MSASANEEPAFEIVKAAGDFEIRRYAAMIRAEITVEASDRGAGNAGFRPLAKYIFGGNTARTKIAMTAPVMQEPEVSQKIAMTAPVMQSPVQGGDGDQAEDEEAWTVAFVMPAKWTMETLPVPEDDRVKLKEIPAQLMAVHSFSGLAGPGKRARKAQALEAFITRAGFRAAGPVTSAYYDPPWTLPPFRRNEVMIPVAAAD